MKETTTPQAEAIGKIVSHRQKKAIDALEMEVVKLAVAGVLVEHQKIVDTNLRRKPGPIKWQRVQKLDGLLLCST